jgi:hypothetical protein
MRESLWRPPYLAMVLLFQALDGYRVKPAASSLGSAADN